MSSFWFLRYIGFVGVSLATSGGSLWAQHNPVIPGFADPAQLAITAKRERLVQDERNIAIHQMALGEFAGRAQKIRRQLEALSFMADDQVSPRVKGFAAELTNELARLNRQVEATKILIDTDTIFLKETRRQLDVMEAQHNADAANRTALIHRLPADEYRERINQQNERLRQEALAFRKQIDLQNQRLMQESEPPHAPDPSRIRLPMPVLGGSIDASEAELCERLAKKVAIINYDIAEINLLAAKGLPGTENLDVEKTLKALDLWSAWVKHETDRHLYRFRQAPGDYNNSEGYFRILMMVCTLQEDFRVCYHKDPKMRAGPVELVPNDFTFFGNPMDLFIHGLTEGEHEGTCASLPVLYVAIGRRLGYPLKLVECKGHLFVRWEDNHERFNIEGTSRGLNCYPDQEYMEWPWPISKDELETGMYMKSLSPKREVAAFLELRSLCLRQHKQMKQHLTVKLFADDLRRQEGVNLDKLNQLIKREAKTIPVDEGIRSVFLYQTLTNTNSWRMPGYERDAPGKRATFSVERFEPK